MSVVEESEALHARVRAFALAREPAEDFVSLALSIAQFQARHSPGFARLVERAGGLHELDRVPPVPADAFRLTRVAAHAPTLDTARFVTSGTTGSARGTHCFRTTRTYAELAVAFGRRALIAGAQRPTVVALAEAPGERPSSSLGFMFERFAESFDGRALDDGPFRPSEPARYLLGPAGIDRAGLERARAIATRRGEPLLVLATSFALVFLLDALGLTKLELPPGSAVMHTGGYKGRTRELSPQQLRTWTAERLGLAPERVVVEYGMTELSSQLYEGTLPGAELKGPAWTLLEPPWLRVVPVHPETLVPVPDGELGLARFVDLANVDSALVVLTRDLVRRVGPGIELVGRAPGSLPRGCSLSVEALVEGARDG